MHRSAALAALVICFSPSVTIPHTLLRGKTSRTWAHFRAEVMLQLVSGPLPSGIRFFRHPKPASPKTSLAACCPRGERYGVSTFQLFKFVGVGACSRPGRCEVTRAYYQAALPISITFWFKRVSHLRLLMITVFIADSHVFTIPTI